MPGPTAHIHHPAVHTHTHTHLFLKVFLSTPFSRSPAFFFFLNLSVTLSHSLAPNFYLSLCFFLLFIGVILSHYLLSHLAHSTFLFLFLCHLFYYFCTIFDSLSLSQTLSLYLYDEKSRQQRGIERETVDKEEDR